MARRNPAPSSLPAAAAGLAALALAAWVWVLSQQAGKPLLGPHSFRQTQTAYAALCMSREPGMFFHYITPVLGKPWEIPMEVPFFQWVVARVVNATGAPLDAAGRVVSAAAWLASLIPAWMLMRSLSITTPVRGITCALLLTSPLYLFWGQAFLMETTGTLLSLAMVALAVAGFQKRRPTLLTASFAFGTAAALCKSTTWAVAAGTGFLLLLSFQPWKARDTWAWAAGSFAALALPVVPAKIWLSWGDAVKMANPFARELLIASSPNQAAWNFGTWEQKISPETWAHIAKHVAEGLLPAPAGLGLLALLGVAILGIRARPQRLPQVASLLAGFAAGPLVFTNLYFEHSYYWCANAVWLLLAVGVAMGGLWESPNVREQVLGLGIAVYFVAGGLWGWKERYFPIIQSLPSHEQIFEAWTRPVQAVVPPARTLLVVGNDWNPNSLYYADRRGIAFPTFKTIPFPGPQLEESLAKLDPEEALGAVVVNPALLQSHPKVIEEFLTVRGFSRQGTPAAFGVIFPALDLKYGKAPGL